MSGLALPVVLQPTLEDKVRKWRELYNEQGRLKRVVDEKTGEKVVSRCDKIGREEAPLRKEIGEELGQSCLAVVDGQPLMYERGEQVDPLDKRYEVAWNALFEWAQTRDLALVRRMEKMLPEPTPRVTHKLT